MIYDLYTNVFISLFNTKIKKKEVSKLYMIAPHIWRYIPDSKKTKAIEEV